jgi:hypothetical protein
MASVLYGSWLRVLECARLRVKDLDFSASQIVVRRGKGKKDRLTLFSNVLPEPLHQHLSVVRRQRNVDIEGGGGFVELPGALSTKYPGAAGLGLVIPTASGVVYSNQTCGNICMQSEIQGVFVPFDDSNASEALVAHFEGPKYLGTGAMQGLDEDDADFIDRVLTDCR